MAGSFVVSPLITGVNNSLTPKGEVGKRVRELQEESPYQRVGQVLKPTEVVIEHAVAKNNIMLENVLANQEAIMQNQAMIMNKLGGNLNLIG